MKGKIVFVTGLSGSGKTTLVGAALEQVPSLKYLTTTTTRPRRTDESTSLEYTFVSDTDYETLRSQSKHWDHTEYQGFKYGADIGEIKSALETGQTIVCAVAPDMKVIKAMERLYAAKSILIWIDTPSHVSTARISKDKIRANRHENELVKKNCNYLFKPSGSLKNDERDFADLIRRL